MFIKRRLPKKLWVFVAIVVIIVSFFQSNHIINDTRIEPIDNLVVRFVDVGQADCEILQFPDGRNIIIDGGKNDTEDILIERIKKYGIKRFDYVIATHPHEDHIGGLDKVIDNFEIDCVYMPNTTSNSKTFDDLLDSIENKNVVVKQAKAGITVIDEEKINMVFLAPNSEYYEETNNYSAVVKLTYNGCSIIFTGDAEALSEREMLANGMDLRAQILKVGHHGSSSSTTYGFLRKVNPAYAVIEVGKDNSYGHPHDEVVEALDGVKVYRTDTDGTITMECDGVNLIVTTEK